MPDELTTLPIGQQVYLRAIVKDAALNWFGELDYALLHGQEVAPGEAAAERASFGEAFLPDRLRAALSASLRSRELRVPATGKLEQPKA